MRELSLHLMDIAQNSISAGASLIQIRLSELRAGHSLRITIEDDGRGMSEEQVKQVTDPFYTTRTTRKVGLGVPLFKMAAEMTGGAFSIRSEEGKGTLLTADFDTAHLDMIPLGDMEQTILLLIHSNPDLDFVYARSLDGHEFVLDTRQLREILGDVPLNNPDVTVWMREYLEENIQEVFSS